MTEHLTEEQIRAYGDLALTPADLLKVSGHLTECTGCRSRAAPLESLRGEMAAVRASLEVTSPHIPYEALESYVERVTTTDVTARIDRHASECELCAASLHDLERLRDELAASSRTLPGQSRTVGTVAVQSQRWRSFLQLIRGPRLGLAGAAAALVFAVLTAVLTRQLDRERADTAERERVLTEQRQSAEAEAANLRQALDDRNSAQLSPSAAAVPSVPALLSFVVTPGVLRDKGDQMLVIDQPVPVVQLQLLTDTEIAADRFQLILVDGSGSTVWASTIARRALFAAGPDHADVVIPMPVLQNGRYTLTLATAAGDVIDDYAFSVSRQESRSGR